MLCIKSRYILKTCYNSGFIDRNTDARGKRDGNLGWNLQEIPLVEMIVKINKGRSNH